MAEAPGTASGHPYRCPAVTPPQAINGVISNLSLGFPLLGITEELKAHFGP